MPEGQCNVTLATRWHSLLRVLFINYPGLIVKYLIHNLFSLKTIFWLILFPLFALRNLFMTVYTSHLLSGELPYYYRLEPKGFLFGIGKISLANPYAIAELIQIDQSIAILCRDGVITYLPSEFEGNPLEPLIVKAMASAQESRGG